jgi:hypothetical protein
MTITVKIAMEIGPPSLSAGIRPNWAAASGAAPAAVRNNIDILTTSQKIRLLAKKPGVKAPPVPGCINYFGICHRTRFA